MNAEPKLDTKNLFTSTYGHLRRIASGCLSGERKDHTLQATALVHEAYLRLADYERIDWRSQAHLVAVASRVMRQVLVNHAKARNTLKRGGGNPRERFEEAMFAFPTGGTELVELDDALRTLSRLSKRLVRVFELRFFGGLANHEAATVLGVSESTIRRDWITARAWLHRQLKS